MKLDKILKRRMPTALLAVLGSISLSVSAQAGEPRLGDEGPVAAISGGNASSTVCYKIKDYFPGTIFSDINNRGDIVGAYDWAYSPSAFAYINGQYVQIPDLPLSAGWGSSHYALRINDDRVVIGGVNETPAASRGFIFNYSLWK